MHAISVDTKTMEALPSTFASSPFRFELKERELKPSRSVVPHVDGAFILDDVLSREECDALIKEAEEKGFQSLEREFAKEDRDNERVMVLDGKLADALWHRISPCVTATDVLFVQPTGFGNHGIWRPHG